MCSERSSDANSIQIKNSYSIWAPQQMKPIIQESTMAKYNTHEANNLLNRSYDSMYIEWWLHNIGYYITKPFYFNKSIYKAHLRFRDVDIDEWI